MSKIGKLSGLIQPSVYVKPDNKPEALAPVPGRLGLSEIWGGKWIFMRRNWGFAMELRVIITVDLRKIFSWGLANPHEAPIQINVTENCHGYSGNFGPVLRAVLPETSR